METTGPMESDCATGPLNPSTARLSLTSPTGPGVASLAGLTVSLMFPRFSFVNSLAGKCGCLPNQCGLHNFDQVSRELVEPGQAQAREMHAPGGGGEGPFGKDAGDC